MIQPHAHVAAASFCHANRRLARAVELSVRGTELLSESNALLRRIAEISQRTIEGNYQYTQLLLLWSSSQSGQPRLQVLPDRQATQDAAWRLARQATRAALDIGVLIDGAIPAWRRGIAASSANVTNLNDMALRILGVAVQVERLARHPAADQGEVAALACAMQGMREITRCNIEVARRSADGVERIQLEALRFARWLATT